MHGIHPLTPHSYTPVRNVKPPSEIPFPSFNNGFDSTTLLKQCFCSSVTKSNVYRSQAGKIHKWSRMSELLWKVREPQPQCLGDTDVEDCGKLETQTQYEVLVSWGRAEIQILHISLLNFIVFILVTNYNIKHCPGQNHRPNPACLWPVSRLRDSSLPFRIARLSCCLDWLLVYQRSIALRKVQECFGNANIHETGLSRRLLGRTTNLKLRVMWYIRTQAVGKLPRFEFRLFHLPAMWPCSRNVISSWLSFTSIKWRWWQNLLFMCWLLI